jgi:protein phosphatase
MSDNKNINEIIIEEPSLILLVGVGSSGKTTFAKKHFLPTQIISSDVCRANICDSETDMRFLQPGFQLLNEILVKRLQAKKLSVIDATNTRLEDRQGYLKMACKYHIPTIAIVFDIELDVSLARNSKRSDRGGCSDYIFRQKEQLSQSFYELRKGKDYKEVFVLSTPNQIKKQKIVLLPRLRGVA